MKWRKPGMPADYSQHVRERDKRKAERRERERALRAQRKSP